MEQYKEIKKLGDGSFGSVTKVQNTLTGEIVAIKKMKQKYTSWDECINLRELQSLRKLTHINIIKLKQVVRVNNELSFVFEYIEKNILQLYDDAKQAGEKLTDNQIQSVIYQIVSALAYTHQHGFFHRDLKPENLLISSDGVVQLIDFGLAREIRSRPPYTDYVSTRWYRAPEILLRSTNYNSPVDIFALGCIMAELYMMKPLFNGTSEVDQLNKICSVLGTPNQNDWSEGYRLASQKNVTFPSYQPVSLGTIITGAPYEAINLIGQMLKWDAQKRPTASQILQHPYFSNVSTLLPSIVLTEENNANNQNAHNESLNTSINSNLNSGQNSGASSTRFQTGEDIMGSGKDSISGGGSGMGSGNTYGGDYLSQNDPFQKPQGSNLSASDLIAQQQQEGVDGNSESRQNYKSHKGLELDTIYEFLNNADAKPQNTGLGGGINDHVNEQPDNKRQSEPQMGGTSNNNGNGDFGQYNPSAGLGVPRDRNRGGNKSIGVGNTPSKNYQNNDMSYDFSSQSRTINNNNNLEEDTLGGYQPSSMATKPKPRVLPNQTPYTINNPLLSQNNRMSYQPSVLDNTGLKGPMRPSNSALDNKNPSFGSNGMYNPSMGGNNLYSGSTGGSSYIPSSLNSSIRTIDNSQNDLYNFSNVSQGALNGGGVGINILNVPSNNNSTKSNSNDLYNFNGVSGLPPRNKMSTNSTSKPFGMMHHDGGF